MRALLALFALAFAPLVGAAPAMPALIIYNASPSMPVGFYVRVGAHPGLGDSVTIAVPRAVRVYASLHGFDHPRDRFIKHVAAIAGQQVCAAGGELRIDTRLVAQRQTHDRAGRTLPWWSGCQVLGADEILLLGERADSFDGRYWGISHVSEIDGVWKRLGAP